ncbi:hypothetical protein [Microbulbifer variabilis]|uniref:hypothetical protein n=1 Tax=Microbulbifer variabilis TaxID=266805 RepID=UPI000363E465|nr:hypothetical protein [Microbulbifer variabilis]
MKKILAVILFFQASFVAAEQQVICTGPVERLAYHQPDGLYLAIGSTGLFKACSSEAQFKRTGPESCKLLASLATTARATGKDIRVYIDNAPTANCADITDWHAADIRFFELMP